MNRIQKELAARSAKNLAPAGVWAQPIGPDGESTYCSPRAVLLDDRIDEREMSAAFVICDSSLDDDGDIVEPQGCREDLDRYRANPIVLWHHDKDSPGIGLTEDKAKNLHLDIGAKRIVAKCFFHRLPFKGQNLSDEIFNLVVKGALRGASVGFIPLESEKRGHRKEDGYRFTRWLLTEWSVTPIPSNRETLRMCLSRGYVKTLELKNRLETYVGNGREWANGAFLSAAGGQSRDAMSRKRKPVVVAVEFDRDVFKTLGDAKAWGKVHGRDISDASELANSFVLTQHDAPPNAGQKQLAKGVVGLLGYATKAYEEDEDEGKKKKKPMDDDIVEKDADDDEENADESDADDAPAEDDAADDEGDLDAEDEGDGDGGDENEGEPTESDADPEQMKIVLRSVKNVIDHCKGYIDAHPELAAEGTPPSIVAIYDWLLGMIDKAQAKLKKETVKLYGGNILDVMDDAPEQAEVDETTGQQDGDPAMDGVPDDERKSLAAQLKSLYNKTSSVAKSVV